MSFVKTMQQLKHFCNQANTDAPQVVLLFKSRSAMAYFEAALMNELAPMMVDIHPNGLRREIKLHGVKIAIGTERD